MLDLTCPLGVRMNKEGYAAYRTAYSLHASRARTYGDMVSMTMILLLRGYLEHLKFRWLQRKWHCPANMMQ